ncbi:MAG TPA: hypothetical protein VF799_11710 [Geobacteraceae bacterium]
MSKLSRETMEAIARGFWRMTSASATAEELGMNCKTVQKYYDLFRRALHFELEAAVRKRFGGSHVLPERFRKAAARKNLGGEAEPLLCLARADGKPSILFVQGAPEEEVAAVPDEEIYGWLYAMDRAARDSLNLDRMHYTRELPDEYGHGSFWMYAKKGLVRYHGGFRRHFHLFMREMEFRFNNHDEKVALAWLMNVLQAKTLHEQELIND